MGKRKRVLVVCLDAFDAALSDRLILSGRLEGLSRLKSESACFDLEHGPGGKARYTGLTWEHFASGRRPESSGKWSVISFDPQTFCVRQSFATERPFLAATEAKCVVFDVPYFDLQSIPNAIGIVGWGGHDLGVYPQSSPKDLMSEVSAKFGPPPDVDALNVMVYPSVALTEEMAKSLRSTVKQRTDIAEWLLTKRQPEWDLALIGYGESHDAIELFYHGIDPEHDLYGIPSAAIARQGLIDVYEEISIQIARLAENFPDAAFVIFTMHGMGRNDTDLPTMLLLPELMYRLAFDRPLFVSRADWRETRTPVLSEDEDWNKAIIGAMVHDQRAPVSEVTANILRKAHRTAVTMAKSISGTALLRSISSRRGPRQKSFALDWMPASQFARYWPKMDAFAVPSFFEGRVRVNLVGREIYGRVPIERYHRCLAIIEKTLHECVDKKTGMPVVKENCAVRGR